MRDRLAELPGKERRLEEVAYLLRQIVQEQNPPTVGALHVTCSDESEGECAEAFQHHFVRHLVPAIKPGRRAAFRSASLGGRYERGAVRIAEANFATKESERSYKLMVVKLNAHVSRDDRMAYGRMDRYQVPSFFCGALQLLLNEGSGPMLDKLRRTFSSGGIDRLALIRRHVPKELHPVAAAIVNVRLQARKAVLDIQDFEPRTPTFYLVTSGVTINQRGPNTELVCGISLVDRRGERAEEYIGLGDDPSKYAFAHDQGGLVVRE